MRTERDKQAPILYLQVPPCLLDPELGRCRRIGGLVLLGLHSPPWNCRRVYPYIHPISLASLLNKKAQLSCPGSFHRPQTNQTPPLLAGTEKTRPDFLQFLPHRRSHSGSNSPFPGQLFPAGYRPIHILHLTPPTCHPQTACVMAPSTRHSPEQVARQTAKQSPSQSQSGPSALSIPPSFILHPPFQIF